MRIVSIRCLGLCLSQLCCVAVLAAGNGPLDSEFFERHIRPILVDRCYECHSEQAGEQQGGLLLDRRSAWLAGGESSQVVVPGEPESSLLISAIRYDGDLQMPPDERLSTEQIDLLEKWILGGAPGPLEDLGETEFSRLGDQIYLFDKASSHWAFQPLAPQTPPPIHDGGWSASGIDRFIISRLHGSGLSPSPPADSRILGRRLYYDLIGLPPSPHQIEDFSAAYASDPDVAVDRLIDALLQSPEYGHHIARMWLDVARYADTDSFYRPDTRTPHYFPFAFTYRDYVIDAFNNDKPYDRFVKEQLAADLLGFDHDSPEIAALGFLVVGPHANRSPSEALDDWIDLTSRGLMGLTVACARCHDHKYEPVPTADYYSLRGVFAAVDRVGPLNEKKQPEIQGYLPTSDQISDYERRRAEIDKKMADLQGVRSGGNNRLESQKIQETELAELLLFHPGAPARAMVVVEKSEPPKSFIFVRGDASARGEEVPRQFLRILDSDPAEFSSGTSGRLELAEKIISPENPLTARVLVNRVWGHLFGSHLVDTPSDFGLQGSSPSHPELLDWLTADFIAHGWSVKHLVRTIARSQTYRQQSFDREEMSTVDSANRLLWRANRKRLSIEQMRDSMLAVAGSLDMTPRGRSGVLWADGYTWRRAIYGFINRFNLDPTLRAFDFPSPMQTYPKREESIVAPQSLFVLNSPFVIDQAAALVTGDRFQDCRTDQQRINAVFATIYQRPPEKEEIARVLQFVRQQESLSQKVAPSARFKLNPWEFVAQSLLMSNEFQYVD